MDFCLSSDILSDHLRILPDIQIFSRKLSDVWTLSGALLSDAELCEEHEETKYSLIGRTMAELWTLLCLDVGKITEKNEN